jgi:hypothetical protein
MVGSDNQLLSSEGLTSTDLPLVYDLRALLKDVAALQHAINR